MVNEILVKSTYSSATQIPICGQRKRMLVNGRMQTVTLNSISVERRCCWDEDKERNIYEFDASETWGNYYIG